MGIHDNVALRRLPEDPGELYHRELSGPDDVPEHISRTHAWQLVHVSHQDQSGADAHGLQQRRHQLQVHHGHLIDDDHIRLQRIVFIAFEMHGRLPDRPVIGITSTRHAVDLKQAVNGLCLVARGLRHTFCRSARRGRQQHIHISLLKVADNRVDNRRLSGTRSARDDEKSPVHRLHHRLNLLFIQFDVILSPDPGEIVPDGLLRLAAPDIQVVEHHGDIIFHIVEPGSVHHPRLHSPDGYLLLDLHIHQMRGNPVCLNSQKPGGSLQEFLLGKAGMAFLGRLHQRIQDAAADAEIGIHGNAGLCGDLIRHAESDAGYVVRQLIGILLQHRINRRSVLFIDLYRHVDGNAVLLQKHQGLAHVALFFHLVCDGHGHPLADALHLRQAFRLFFHDPEGILLELLYDPFGQRRPDALNGPGA